MLEAPVEEEPKAEAEAEAQISWMRRTDFVRTLLLASVVVSGYFQMMQFF